MILAGLWETRPSPAQETVRSFTIITTTPNELCAQVHNRMPVILAPDRWSQWMGKELADEETLKGLLRPYDAGLMTMWPLDRRVDSEPSLVEPVVLS
jgi:putative SOS response-associated peptidase YedK